MQLLDLLISSINMLQIYDMNNGVTSLTWITVVLSKEDESSVTFLYFHYNSLIVCYESEEKLNEISFPVQNSNSILQATF